MKQLFMAFGGRPRADIDIPAREQSLNNATERGPGQLACRSSHCRKRCVRGIPAQSAR
jgi:hypothetical protein